MKINSKFLPVVLGLLASSYGYANHDMLSKDYVRVNIEKLESMIEANQIPTSIDEYLLTKFGIDVEIPEDKAYLIGELHKFEEEVISEQLPTFQARSISLSTNTIQLISNRPSELSNIDFIVDLSDDEIMDSMRANIEFGDSENMKLLMSMAMVEIW